MFGLKFFFEDFFEHGVIAVGHIAVVPDPGVILFVTPDVLFAVKPETIDDCVSSHFLFLLFLFVENLNNFVLTQNSREADASASAGQAAQEQN